MPADWNSASPAGRAAGRMGNPLWRKTPKWSISADSTVYPVVPNDTSCTTFSASIVDANNVRGACRTKPANVVSVFVYDGITCFLAGVPALVSFVAFVGCQNCSIHAPAHTQTHHKGKTSNN